MINKKLGLALLLTNIFSANGFAATATGHGSATVVTPIAIAEDAAIRLNFGDLDASTGGTVAVSVAGVRSKTGAVVLLNNASNAPSQGQFHVTGNGTNTYAITLPSSPVSLSDGAAHTMSVDTFASNPSGTGALTAGAQDINVGATLTVASAQAPGLYAGTYDVSVDYN